MPHRHLSCAALCPFENPNRALLLFITQRWWLLTIKFKGPQFESRGLVGPPFHKFRSITAINSKWMFSKLTYQFYALLSAKWCSIVGLVPLSEWGGVNLYNGILHQSLSSHQFVIAGIVNYVNDARLSGLGLNFKRFEILKYENCFPNMYCHNFFVWQCANIRLKYLSTPATFSEKQWWYP